MDDIMDLFKNKSAVKYEVYHNTMKVFSELKKVSREFALDSRKQLAQADLKHITVEYRDKGDFECDLKFAGDILLMVMHTNVFEFPRDHVMMKSSYVKEDISRSYCGIIYLYNFLWDSFKYNRTNDIGYLVGRIFVNKEFHFLVEGKRQMEFLNNTFGNQVLDKAALRKILETAIKYCVEFDLLLTPYDEIKETTLEQMQEYSSHMRMVTGKRLGFRFQADPDERL